MEELNLFFVFALIQITPLLISAMVKLYIALNNELTSYDYWYSENRLYCFKNWINLVQLMIFRRIYWHALWIITKADPGNIVNVWRGIKTIPRPQEFYHTPPCFEIPGSATESDSCCSLCSDLIQAQWERWTWSTSRSRRTTKCWCGSGRSITTALTDTKSTTLLASSSPTQSKGLIKEKNRPFLGAPFLME